MNIRRTILFAVLLLACGAADDKNSKGLKITDKVFRQTSSLLLDDPLNKSARDWSRLILLYTSQAPNATVALGLEELRWLGLGIDDSHSQLLLAAYAAGNIQSQLNSGVKRNDRYSGLLTLFRVYRALREQNKSYTIAAVDTLLGLHEQNKLMSHLQKLDEEKPAKMTPEGEAVLRRLMRTR